ncbi:MAG: AMP-binding protein [Rhodocyclaceae bacterium]|nr:AMP-binding protein [Rhodocyclaceae bacterium]
MDIGGYIDYHARFRGDQLGVVFDDQRLSWRAFNVRVERLAAALRACGVVTGDRVATVLANHLELLDVYWACARLGAVAVPLSPLLMKDGLSSLLRDAAPKVVFASAATAAPVAAACAELAGSPEAIAHRVLVDGDTDSFVAYDRFIAAPIAVSPAPTCGTRADYPRIDPDSLYNIMYTSGTTGMPKGIMITHRVRALYASLFANAWRMTPESVVLHTGAIVFNGAFLTLLPAFALGATYILHRQFTAESFIETVAREKVTHTFMVPAQIASVLASPCFSPEKLASLQMLGSVGAPLPVAQKDKLEALLPGRFHELYGLTEGIMTILDKRDVIKKRGSVGPPMPYTEMRIVSEAGKDLPPGEVGEIVARGPLLMAGYYQRPDLTAAAVLDGWLYTGDLGFLDADGYLFLVDRKKDMIDTGGVKVYPRDIEEVIARHPAVQEAVVFGIPDAKWGETPVAAVQLIAGTSLNAEALQGWINERVAARYQRVSKVDLVANFPRNAAGKVLKRELRDVYWQNQENKI